MEIIKNKKGWYNDGDNNDEYNNDEMTMTLTKKE